MYIYSERVRNPDYGYKDYVKQIDRGVHEESEKFMKSHTNSYPLTMTAALTMAIQKLVEKDLKLKKVFTTSSIYLFIYLFIYVSI